MPKLSVLSTLATDTLVDEKGAVLSVQSGGPAQFIKDALQDVSVPFDLLTRETITVEILMTPKGEFGRIPQQPTSHLITEEALSEWTLVSTLLDEWRFPAADELPSHLCIDLQGYVRNGKDFGKKKIWQDAERLMSGVFCMKGTKEEVKYLPAAVHNTQKQRLLVVTDGENGIEVFDKGQSIKIPAPQKLQGLPNTIGAGDTFFGYFVAALSQGKSSNEAGIFAMAKTTQFLKKKQAQAKESS